MLRRLTCLISCLCSLALSAAFYTDFSTDYFAGDPWWVGNTNRFLIGGGWLQSNLAADNQHASIAVENATMLDAEWTIVYHHDEALTGDNYARFFLAADRLDLHNANGYYVQLGGQDAAVALVFRQGNERLTLAKSTALLSGKEGTAKVVVGRSADGQWELRVNGTLYGTVRHDTWHQCAFCGVYVCCGTDEGQRTCHYFGEIEVIGDDDTQFDDDPIDDPIDDPTDNPIDDPTESHYDVVDAQDGMLLINEIMFHPAAGAQEYVEIINLSDDVVDLSGITITTRTGKGVFNTGNKFPVGSYCLPHDVAALTANATALAEQFCTGDTSHIYSTKWRQALNNTAQTLFLLSEDKTVCYDSVYYHKSFHSPLLADDAGVSLERISATADSMDPDTWHSAAYDPCGYGTPGLTNSQQTDIEDQSLSKTHLRPQPEAFSPNGDGHDDICIIYYDMPDADYQATISLFTPTGLCVATIADNVLMAKTGHIIWDGTTSSGTTAQIGIYALVMQATKNGARTIKEKIPLVIIDR